MTCKRTNIWSWDGLSTAPAVRSTESESRRWVSASRFNDPLGLDALTAPHEYKQICRKVIQLRNKQGEAAVKQQLELDVNGVTEWRNAATLPPEHSGWYDTRFNMTEEEREERQPPEGRRYWHADKQHFSWLVPEGVCYNDDALATFKDRLSSIAIECLEYRGSTTPLLPEHINPRKLDDQGAFLSRRRIAE